MITSTAFSSWLFVLFGMILLDTILCVFFLRKTSEGLLEFTITVLIFIIAKLLERNPIEELDSIVFICIAAGAVMIALCVMFYHLFIKVIPASPYRRNRKKKRYNKNNQQPTKSPAKNDYDQ